MEIEHTPYAKSTALPSQEETQTERDYIIVNDDNVIVWPPKRRSAVDGDGEETEPKHCLPEDAAEDNEENGDCELYVGDCLSTKYYDKSPMTFYMYGIDMNSYNYEDNTFDMIDDTLFENRNCKSSIPSIQLVGDGNPTLVKVDPTDNSIEVELTTSHAANREYEKYTVKSYYNNGIQENRSTILDRLLQKMFIKHHLTTSTPTTKYTPSKDTHIHAIVNANKTTSVSQSPDIVQKIAAYIHQIPTLFAATDDGDAVRKERQLGELDRRAVTMTSDQITDNVCRSLQTDKNDDNISTQCVQTTVVITYGKDDNRRVYTKKIFLSISKSIH
jgi:hypothetical protein